MISINVLTNQYFKTELDLPTLGTAGSTGYDLKAISEPEIIGEIYDSTDTNNLSEIIYKQIQYIQYHTGFFVKIKQCEISNIFTVNHTNYDALILPRSSISKYNLQLANSVGLCDSDYTGEYIVRFRYIIQPSDIRILNGNKLGCVIDTNKIYHTGDKICQIKFTNVIHGVFKLVDNLEKTTRGNGGFGSTDERKVQNISDQNIRYQTTELENIRSNIVEKYVDRLNKQTDYYE